MHEFVLGTLYHEMDYFHNPSPLINIHVKLIIASLTGCFNEFDSLTPAMGTI